MPDARFFPAAGPFPLSHLAEIAGVRLAGDADAARLVSNVAPLDAAGPDDISFLDNRSYLPQLTTSAAGFGIVEERYAAQAPAGMALLIADSPYLAYARIASEFHPRTEDDYIPLTAGECIHPSAEIGEDTEIGAGAVIGPGARIGARCRIGPNAYIGRAVAIGDDCRIGANASVRYALIGNRVTLYSGVRIGEAGFGFARSPTGAVTVPQVGRVIVEDRVEIGANTTVDRGAGPDTVIGAGTRIDNLVQIGHNVRIGQQCIIVAQTGIAGSTRLGNGVQVGGQVGIAGHLMIGDGAQIAARAGLMRDVAAGTVVAGVPAVPIKQFFRQTAALGRLAEKKGSE